MNPHPDSRVSRGRQNHPCHPVISSQRHSGGYLDQLHTLPGWAERPTPGFYALVDQAVQGERWIKGGNYCDCLSCSAGSFGCPEQQTLEDI